MLKFHLRYLLPALLLLLGAIQAIVLLLWTSVTVDDKLNDDALTQLNTEMTRLQGTIQFLARSGSIEQIQAELSALGSDTHLSLAVLFDERNVSISSNKIEYTNLELNELFQQTGSKNIDETKTLLNDVRLRIKGKVWVEKEQSNTIAGVYPVILSPQNNFIRPNRIGILFLEEDLSLVKNIIRSKLIDQMIVVVLVLFLISLSAVYLLSKIITSRIEHLVNFTADFASGDLKTRSNIEGKDEIAILAKAFNKMADQVTATQETLSTTNQRLQLIMDSTAEGIFGVDTNAMCVFANNACLRLLGFYNISDLVSTNMRTIISNIPLADITATHTYQGQMFLSLHDGKPRHVDKEILFKNDGSSFVCEYWSYPLLERTKIVGAVITMLDVSRRVEAQQELAQYQNNLESLVTHRTKQLEVSNKELSAYSYSIAHDLRTPLRAVTSFSQILMEDSNNKLNDSERDALNRIITAGKHMARLIDDILELSKLSRTILQIEEIDVQELANAVLLDARKGFEEKKVILTVESQLKIFGDRSLLAMVFVNLIANAIKYNDETIIQITIGGNHSDDLSEYFVKDNGIGFDMRFADKIFRPFERLHKTQSPTGTGVGLSIVKRVIERHGGETRVTSNPGEGAIFYFSIPKNVEKYKVF